MTALACSCAAILAGASSSHAAVNVTVGGKQYLVKQQQRTLTSFESLLKTQPWYNDEAVAKEFAAAVGSQLGMLNQYTLKSGAFTFKSDYGPVFIYNGQYPVPTTSSWGAAIYGPQDSFPITGPSLNAFLSTYAANYSASITYDPSTNVLTYDGPLDQWEFSGINSPQGDYIATAEPVPAPGPMPVLGAVAAFGFSRRLRKRIKP